MSLSGSEVFTKRFKVLVMNIRNESRAELLPCKERNSSKFSIRFPSTKSRKEVL